MYCFWLFLQPYSYSNFGGYVIPQVPVNFAQNAYAYQVPMHIYTHTQTSLLTASHAGSSRHCTYTPTYEKKDSTSLCLPHIQLALLCLVEGSLDLSFVLCFDCSPLFPLTVHSNSLDGRPEDTACQSGDSVFTWNKSRQSKTNNKIKVSKKQVISHLKTLQSQWDENIGDFQNPLDYVACPVFYLFFQLHFNEEMFTCESFNNFISVVFVTTNFSQTAMLMEASRWCCLASIDIQ